MDRRFRTKEHIQDLLDTKCLALVPLLTNSRTKRPLAGWLPVRTFSALSSLPLNLRERPEPAKTSARGATKSIGSVPTTLRGMADVTSSPFAEAIETMKLAIDLGDPAASSKIIGLTSSFAGEGKSTLAMGLAAQLARDGARVVLVDCDLRNPTLSRAIAPHAIVGILEVVKRKITPSEAIWNEPNTRIAFLPAVLPSVVDRHSPTPVNFLSSDAAKSFFQALQVQYDCVIVDLPPLACASDVRASTRFIDSYLLVVEWGRTKVDAVQYALRHAPEVSEKVIGTVLNKVDFAAMSSYDNYGARYYYGQSGAARSRH